MAEIPVLTGADKQTIWAAEIRAAWLAEIGRVAAQGSRTMEQRGALDDPRYLAFTAGWDAEVAAILAEYTDAGWWIDRRPIDFNEGPDRAHRAGTLSGLTTRVKQAAMGARDATAADER